MNGHTQELLKAAGVEIGYMQRHNEFRELYILGQMANENDLTLENYDYMELEEGIGKSLALKYWWGINFVVKFNSIDDFDKNQTVSKLKTVIGFPEGYEKPKRKTKQCKECGAHID